MPAGQPGVHLPLARLHGASVPGQAEVGLFAAFARPSGEGDEVMWLDSIVVGWAGNEAFRLNQEPPERIVYVPLFEFTALLAHLDHVSHLPKGKVERL